MPFSKERQAATNEDNQALTFQMVVWIFLITDKLVTTFEHSVKIHVGNERDKSGSTIKHSYDDFDSYWRRASVLRHHG